eukprot:367653-Prorocentrum_minimum.AAC.1
MSLSARVIKSVWQKGNHQVLRDVHELAPTSGQDVEPFGGSDVERGGHDVEDVVCGGHDVDRG